MKQPREFDLTGEKREGFEKRVKSLKITHEDAELIEGLLEALDYVRSLLNEKTRSIRRLLGLVFGIRTEKMKNIFGKSEADKESTTSAASNLSGDSETEDGSRQKKRKGHGRNGAGAYSGAERVKVSHSDLCHGDRCPLCPKGKVYHEKVPSVVIRFTAKAPIQVTIYELEKLRCNCCGEIFTAEKPKEVGEKKYDETVGSMVALLKYGSGLPFNRIERLQESVGIPLPASTQWDIVKQAARQIAPVFDEMVRQAAQGKVIHNDDTNMKILSLMKDNKEKEKEDQEDSSSRTGVFTTGILSVNEDRKIALFFTGRNHAGENMAELLQQRHSGLSPPIQMCDGLSRNTSGEFESILCNCTAHARRKFVDKAMDFPEEARYVIETLAKVYQNDHTAKVNNFTPEQRLEFHKEKSGPLMKKLKEWLDEQFTQKKVEPNSGMGQAISYMRDHWIPLTRFLEVENAPLDNNLCEQVLKKSILHRKNALFFKTVNGAFVGDLFMSLIHTCNLSSENPFEYLTALQRNFQDMKEQPELWMPWNYKARLSALAAD